MKKYESFLLRAALCVASSSAQAQVRIVVAESSGHPISPLIYGVNFASEADARALNIPVNRSGGNGMTRYNWKINASNHAADWYFMSIAEDVGGANPSGTVDAFVAANRTAGVQSMVTIPMIGWVAKLGPGRDSLESFSVSKYGKQEKTEPNHPDIGNGKRPDGKPLTGNDPTDAHIPADIAFERGWIEHFVQKYGAANKGGVKYYLLDNEPGLWQETHRDVTPTGFRMDDFWLKARDTAAMIKAVDPTALVAGPEEWGWIGYLYSGFDAQWAGKNGYDKPRPDRTAHDNMDFSAWLLKQFASEEKRTGKRLLDVFTLHYYPQAAKVDSDDVSETTHILRMRSTRSLWDKDYRDESWINDKIYLIPRMKEWVKTYYPGTKIGITEYEFGAEGNISGGLAQLDALGIFGRESVDLATRWVCPKKETPTYRAFQLLRNYDGKNSSFGDISLPCQCSENPDNFAAFAAKNSTTGKTTLLLLNKQMGQETTIRIDHRFGKIQMYRLEGAKAIEALPDAGPMNALTLKLPAMSATLLVY